MYVSISNIEKYFKRKRRRKEQEQKKKTKLKNNKDEQDVQQNSKYELFNSLFTIYKKKRI